jgi:hypothetical protein
MLVGNVPGWREVFSDDFSGSSLSWRWTSYWGVPGGDPGGFFDPTHVSVAVGQLVIGGFKDPADNAWDAGPNTYVTGGISSSPSFAQTYGKHLVRFGFDPGVGIAHAILLWPQSNAWPPEIDFLRGQRCQPPDGLRDAALRRDQHPDPAEDQGRPDAVAHTRRGMDGRPARLHARRQELGDRVERSTALDSHGPRHPVAGVGVRHLDVGAVPELDDGGPREPACGLGRAYAPA